MSATEFESLIEEILISSTPAPQGYYPVQMPPQGMQYMGAPATTQPATTANEQILREITQPILEELKAMRQDLSMLDTRIDSLEGLNDIVEPTVMDSMAVLPVVPVSDSTPEETVAPATEDEINITDESGDMIPISTKVEELTKKEQKAARKAEKAAAKAAKRALRGKE